MSEMKPIRTMDDLGDGTSEGLEPLRALDLARATSFDSMLSMMASTAFGGRQLGEAADVLEEMIRDPDCTVVGTFSGAMTMAKMGLVLTEMIERGMLDAVVSTGALICHGFVEESGLAHFKHDPHMNDTELYNKGFNRVYDTIELEKSLDATGWQVIDVLDAMPREKPFASYELCAELGKWLVEKGGGRGILQAAHARNVPVYIPAFTDSELGLVVYEYSEEICHDRGSPPIHHDPFRDLDHFRRLLASKQRIGIFTIGGGVPRNWAQQIGPLVDAVQRRRTGACTDPIRIRYGVRICPEPTHWGGLSGCTYSEGVSWGKFIPRKDGGRFAEVYADATIAWPILTKAVIERLEK